MTDRLDELDYYTLLGVAPQANVDEVRVAFHKFALRYHPDRHVGRPEDTVQRAAQIYRRGAEAYRVLLDLGLRREYDAALRTGRLRLDASPPTPVSHKNTHRGHDLRSTRARPFLQKAEKALATGDLRQARLNLQIALRHDPDNAELRTKLEGVESQIRRR